MLSPDILCFRQLNHYLMEYPDDEREVRKVVVAAGTRNGVPFEAITKNDPSFAASLSLFREDGEQFSKIEFQSIRRGFIGAKPMETFDLRGVPEARALGVKWDNLLKKWFVFSNSPNFLKIEKHFNRDKS